MSMRWTLFSFYHSLYYACLSAALLLFCPVLLASPKHRAGLRQKLGIIPRSMKEQLRSRRGEPTVWFHAVSVGELTAALPLVRDFARLRPESYICVSTSTATGQKLAGEKLKEYSEAKRLSVLYFPLDLPLAFRPWLSLIAPQMVIIVETEIWPGFLHECRRRNIRLALVNARMSPRSFKRYKCFGKFFARVLNDFDLIAAQSAEQALHFETLCKSANLSNSPSIVETGNLKYTQLEPVNPEQLKVVRSRLNISEPDQVIIGGSTHNGEESALLQSYANLLHHENHWTQKHLRLVIAPRHPERFDAVCRLVRSFNLTPVRYSSGDTLKEPGDVFILDTIGLLSQYYAASTVAFVGGTLVPVGGHNLVEPYVYGVPVVCGPFLFKTREAAQHLETIGALTVVQNTAQLQNKLRALLCDDASRQRHASAGRQWLKNNQSAVTQTITLLEQILSSQQTNELVA